MSPFTGYAEVKDYLYGLKHRGASYGIERMRHFCRELNLPNPSIPIIHVAGTNGKGSACAMLEAIYRHAGFKTGMFTSPHLVFQGERVQVNRVALSHDDVWRYTTCLRPVAERIEAEFPGLHPTFFEFMTGMAFLRFSEANVDISILETGLGGELDATNVVDPAISVITSISFDHVDILGHRIEDIAKAKAGIIKQGRPVVIGILPTAAEQVIREVAKEKQASVYSVQERFGNSITNWPRTNLSGDYQRANAALATLTAEVLQSIFKVNSGQIEAALQNINWAGRWEKHALADKSLILDASHNPEGAVGLDQNLSRLVGESGTKPLIITGTLGNYRASCLMPVVAKYAREIYLLRPNQPRACTEEELLSCIPSDYAGKIHKTTVRELFPAPGVTGIGQAGDSIVATGSIYLIGEIMEALYYEIPVGEQTLQD
jgi:dihydrofolate synthase/folylpolyglutamate synthase